MMCQFRESSVNRRKSSKKSLVSNSQLHDMAVDELFEMGDFSVGQSPQVRDSGIHRTTGSFIDAAVIAVGKYLVALSDVVLDLEPKIFPLSGQALEDIFDDRVETDVGPGIRKTCGFGPASVIGQRRGGVARILLGVDAFVGAFDQAQVIH